MSIRLSILLSLLALAAAGCEDGRVEFVDSGAPPPGTDGGAPPPGTDAGPPAPTCECGADEVCVEGTCTPLPASCPCPIESYCDVAADRCVAGCLSDGDCSTGRICDADARACRAGCREDGDCGAGQICDATTCRAGCRADGDCGGGEICLGSSCATGCRDDSGCAGGEICEGMSCRAGCTGDAECASSEICIDLRCTTGCRDDGECGSGSICESMSCRSGCRADADCGVDATCMATPMTCATCPADPDEEGDTSVSTRRGGSDDVTRVLCGTSDMDRVRWSYDGSPGYYSISASVRVMGADPSATTTIEMSTSGASETFTLVGDGYTQLYRDEYDYYCFEGRCADIRRTFEATTDSESPVTLEYRFYIGTTR